jgi:hypothetical protein
MCIITGKWLPIIVLTNTPGDALNLLVPIAENMTYFVPQYAGMIEGTGEV